MALRILQTLRLSITLSLWFGGVASLYAQMPAQRQTEVNELRQLSQRLLLLQQQEKAAAESLAARLGWPIRRRLAGGGVFEIQALGSNGQPVYCITNNLNAAKTISADKLWPGGASGFNLSGVGIKLGIWDGGKVLPTHQELSGRVTQRDAVTRLEDHATHVSGTMIGKGVDAGAKGMAFEALLDAYDFNSDDPEMAAAAAAGLKVSNHSYGFIRGWIFNFYNDGLWVWFGDLNVNTREDYLFGFYDNNVRTWDQIAFNAPYYLIVKAAGNDRTDAGPAPGTTHWVFQIGNSRVQSNDVRDPDGGNTGYDTIGDLGVAKNILTIGAVNDIPGGYTNPSEVTVSSFSSWGPADDGRIKPDLAANGVSLRSSISSSNSAYANFSGTSMSTPNTSGTLGLLMQHYQNTHAGASPRAATLKALAIHSADEAGSSAGPDYKFGWGLLNALTAASVISADAAGSAMINERSLANSRTDTFSVNLNGGAPFRVTIAWTDPPATPVSPALDPSNKMLVNDLDLRVSNNTTTFMPWILNRQNPAGAATTGDNLTDNVEQVFIASPTPGRYVVAVSHKNTLLNGSQDYSLILTSAGPGQIPGGVVKAAAANCLSSLPKDCTVTISITIDMTGTSPAQLLSSLSGSLSWNPTVLGYASHSGLQSGFTGTVNTTAVPSGRISFSGMNATGVGDTVRILDVTFEVSGTAGASNLFDLDFTAMFSAGTAVNLLPILAVNDCNATVANAGLLGDVNGDGAVNSTDALILLAYDASLPIAPPFLSRIMQGYGDVDGNRATNSTDALAILSFDVSLPVPFPIGQAFCP